MLNTILGRAITHLLSVYKFLPRSLIKQKVCSLCSYGKIIKEKEPIGKKRALIQCPRRFGRLGIRNVGTLNNALLLKKAWRIKRNPQLLLAKLYNSCMFPGRQQLINHWLFSWGRKGILSAENLLNDFCRWKVGNGVSILVSTHKWIPGGVLQYFVTTLHWLGWRI